MRAFLPRKGPWPAQIFQRPRIRGYATAVTPISSFILNERRSRLDEGKQKRGAPRGLKVVTAEGETVASRTSRINFRARGKTVTKRKDKTEGDVGGKMVHGDIDVDINGIPYSLPEIRYERIPMAIRKAGTYEDRLRRGSGPAALVRAIKNEVEGLAKDVAKLEWERSLRMTPPVSQKILDHNKKIIDVLEGKPVKRNHLRLAYVEQGRGYTAKQLKKAIRSIASHLTPILTGMEAMTLPGIGKATADKIQEIIDTGHLRRLMDPTTDETAMAIQLFSTVPGMEQSEAVKHAEHGLRTISELRKLDKSKLSPEVCTGFKYYEDLQKKIPRDEVDVWNITVLAATELVDPELQAVVVGDYRRGSRESDYVKILLTHPKYTHISKSTTVSIATSTIDSIPTVFEPFIQKLRSSGHIEDHLKITPTRYTAIARIPQTDPPLPHRQVIFHFVPWHSFVFAELSHTGSEDFLLRVRDQAARLGFELGPTFLKKRKEIMGELFGANAIQFLEETSETKEYHEGDLVHLSSEEDIFRFLNMKYVPPHERNW